MRIPRRTERLAVAMSALALMVTSGCFLEDSTGPDPGTAAPARAFGLSGGTLAAGAAADLCVIAPERPFTIEADALRSRSKNTPFLGRMLVGRAVLTLVEGRAMHDLDGKLAP